MYAPTDIYGANRQLVDTNFAQFLANLAGIVEDIVDVHVLAPAAALVLAESTVASLDCHLVCHRLILFPAGRSVPLTVLMIARYYRVSSGVIKKDMTTRTHSVAIAPSDG
jgi:hypothetical protein